ncbi:GNAT family N-acetyltransferase [Filobacillus milosensis]|uniref:GNAT family N-acetyltransferase n=1 Tax=Filobacillus milosensis TaxID=94137 RepID=A0A4Y8IE16_9BACI|nr:GNAT family N-acetyltransferase [Filobacillus milosensis]TFB14232.1 GNAT family N-acetyltransferase [Filobacillus milosensis]
MHFSAREMNQERANEITSWKYDEPYDFYNMSKSKETINELMNEAYTAVINEKEELVGFFCTGKSAQVPVGALNGVYEEELLDVGLGLKPELTGQGLGRDFMVFIIDYLDHQPLRLTVANFNQRAIRLYAKVGFSNDREFYRSSVKFITMVKR